MLCPRCLFDVPEFARADFNSERAYKCPRPDCGESVAVQYVEDYYDGRPVVFSVMGLRSHGKTAYLASLLNELERLVEEAEWPDLFFNALDESGLSILREKQNTLKSGYLPEASQKLFPEPVILRLEGIPDFGKCDLLMYDTSGEAFQHGEGVQGLREYGGYALRSRTLICLVSLTEIERVTDASKAESASRPKLFDPEFSSDAELSNLLGFYVQGIRSMGGTPLEQDIVVVLTKGDELLMRDDLPKRVRAMLEGEISFPSFDELESWSDEVEAWLAGPARHRNAVRFAREKFRTVQYCVVSALGSRPIGVGQPLTIVPRGVIMPLMWALKLEKEWELLRNTYEVALKQPEMLKFCRIHNREQERQHALSHLVQGWASGADMLVRDYNASMQKSLLSKIHSILNKISATFALKGQVRDSSRVFWDKRHFDDD